MADTLKPDMLDSVDAELSKPTTPVLAQAYCATVISNLEGWRGLKLSCAKEISEVTISQVDMRIRRLEMTTSINPPPPVDIPSWESLMWRVARLHRMMVGVTPNRFGQAPPIITPSLDLLRTTMASIGGMGPQSWAVFTEGEDLENGDRMIPAAAQYLCNLAGKRGFKIIGSFELAASCNLALELSLDRDANPALYVGPGPPLPRQGMPVPPARSFPKVCCGCCACSCHNKASLPPRVVNVTKGKYKRPNQRSVRARITYVFRKLAFWRRRSADDSDSDSIASATTTGSSSTLN
ncbi:hypothetical protein F5Y03DRAFT_179194 [Xylaria venustula]|nr:hypothetical protein F5Y03DRAFT_179194 [Xylaria venustula]